MVGHGGVQRRRRRADDRERAAARRAAARVGLRRASSCRTGSRPRSTVASAARRSTSSCRARAGRGATRSSPPCATGGSARRRSTTRSCASCASRRASGRWRAQPGRRGARVSTTRRSARCCAAPPRPASCWRTTTARALPLDPSALRRVAVIGPNAAAGRTLGGGSATVYPPYTVSPLDGLRAALPDAVRVDHAAGVLATDRIPVAGPPLAAHARRRRPRRRGAVRRRRRRRPRDRAAARLRLHLAGLLRPRPRAGRRRARRGAHACSARRIAGTYAIAGSGVGRYVLAVGGDVVFDGELELRAGADVVEGMMLPPQAVHDVHLDAGEDVEIVLTHDVGSANHDAGDLAATFQLNLRPPHATDDEEIERAVALARDADVAIVVVGTTEEVESEGFDRASLALPGRQDELVGASPARIPTTVVVVNAGAPVLLPWADRVAAISRVVPRPGVRQRARGRPARVSNRAAGSGRSANEEAAVDAAVEGVLRYDEGLSVGYERAARRAVRSATAWLHDLGVRRDRGAGRRRPGAVDRDRVATGTRTGGSSSSARRRPASAVGAVEARRGCAGTAGARAGVRALGRRRDWRDRRHGSPPEVRHARRCRRLRSASFVGRACCRAAPYRSRTRRSSSSPRSVSRTMSVTTSGSQVARVHAVGVAHDLWATAELDRLVVAVVGRQDVGDARDDPDAVGVVARGEADREVLGGGDARLRGRSRRRQQHPVDESAALAQPGGHHLAHTARVLGDPRRIAARRAPPPVASG